MRLAGRFAKRLWMRAVIERLRLSYRALGIEVVNGDLLSRTQGTKHVLVGFGACIDPSARVHGPLIIHNADRDYSNLVVGENVHIGRGVLFDLSAPLVIGRGAVIAMQATILTHTDAGPRPAAKNVGLRVAKVEIGTGAYVGARALILPGVTLGAECVVAAGAVVTRDVPDGVRVAGVPARPLAADPASG